MDFVLGFFNYLSSLGASVMLPIIIFILGLILGAKPGKAFRAALTIGVAFVGIGLVVGLLGGNLGPAAQAMAVRTGVQLDVVDVGWRLRLRSPLAEQLVPGSSRLHSWSTLLCFSSAEPRR